MVADKKNKKQIKPQSKKKNIQSSKPSKKRTSPAEYIRQVGLELKKVAWPQRQEVIVSTVIVIIVVVIFASITFVFDASFSGLLKVVSNSVGKAALK